MEHDIEEATPYTDSDSEPYSFSRLIMIAGAGALTSLGLYYIYQQLDEEKRSSLRRKASNLVFDGFQKFTQARGDDDSAY